jgi:hypothetical protein
VPHAAIEKEVDALRELVVASRGAAAVEADAEACLTRLNRMYQKAPDLFTPEDVRFVNMLRGTLAVRLAAHRGGGPFARVAKPKGTRLDHCWRCETPLDVRFTEVCPGCSTKAKKSLVCPVCRACGCQPAGRVLV